MVRVHSLRRGATEAIEAVAHGLPGQSKVVGKRIEEIELPPETTIGGIIRGEEVIIAHHDVMIQNDDHVILFVADQRQVSRVERLFSVDAVFL
jgi:trk system potassium uptake protein